MDETNETNVDKNETSGLRNGAAADRAAAERACAEHSAIGVLRMEEYTEATEAVRAARLGGIGAAGARWYRARDAWVEWVNAWDQLPEAIRAPQPGLDISSVLGLRLVVDAGGSLRVVLSMYGDTSRPWDDRAWEVPLKACGFKPPAGKLNERWQALADYGV